MSVAWAQSSMISLYTYQTPPGPCGYLPDQIWQYEHEIVAVMSPEEYQERLRSGWRRFGHLIFRPNCPSCQACRSLRVEVERFRPNRSQKRNRKLNESDVTVTIAEPHLSDEVLDLYDRYHAYRSATKGWPDQLPKDPAEFRASFVENPFSVQEWRYHLGSRLVGVGYVDAVPEGLSAVYFFHDPNDWQRGLGTWNVLSIIDRAAKLQLPFVYLGYFVAGSASLEYKANFRPYQIRDGDGIWHSVG